MRKVFYRNTIVIISIICVLCVFNLANANGAFENNLINTSSNISLPNIIEIIEDNIPENIFIKVPNKEERSTKISAEKKEEEYFYTESILTQAGGVNWGPTGFETYYNLPMEGVVGIMRGMGFSADEYPYWIRDDGCKMLGDYIMVAANLEHFPRGSIVDCSLGKALVCDTGGFASSERDWSQLDIATNW